MALLPNITFCSDVKDIEIGDEDIDQYYTKFQQ